MSKKTIPIFQQQTLFKKKVILAFLQLIQIIITITNLQINSAIYKEI